MSKLSRAFWQGGRKRKESLRLHLWNLNSTSPVAPRQLSCQISANQHGVETSANDNKHWKTRAKGNDVITNVIFTNQDFASTFAMQIFNFQTHSCKLSFPFPSSPPEVPLRACSQASAHCTNSILGSFGSLLLNSSDKMAQLALKDVLLQVS